MNSPNFDPTTRRRALAMAGQLATGLMAANVVGGGVASAQTTADWGHMKDRIEDILQAEGTVANGVLSISIERTDINNVTLDGVPILPSFQINGDLNFQMKNGGVIMNSDLCVKASEMIPFLDALIAHDIVIQAEHQHFYDFVPVVWFVHFRAFGDGEVIARGIKAALNTTSTPFPQKPPANPHTPLPAREIGLILGGTPSIGAGGVVSVNIPRREQITLGGIPISPFLNVASPIVFQPYGGGINAAAAPDFGMLGSETQNVLRLMRSLNWDIGCLYNQETEENPQLFFSHQFKTGNALALAREIRRGLDLTNSVRP